MSAGSRLLMLGLQGSGKTSFLAALWHLIESNELPSSLTAPALQPNREYLNRIRDSWLRFQEVGRTPLRTEELISLVLRDTQTHNAIDISLPDWSGESLRLQWAVRKARRSYADRAHGATGVVLFIHPNTVKRTTRIDLESAARSSVSTSSLDEKSKEWSSELTSTQIELVELLQFVTWLREAPQPLRIVVVVSAWDLVRTPVAPSSWLELRLPVLHQFLTSNGSAMPFQVFGVSALGGDLKDDISTLQEKNTPSSRVRVVNDALNETHDLTLPLRFLLNLDATS
jgi:hypothetical protein